MQESMTTQRALQVIQEALDSVVCNGPQRRLLDKAYMTLTETVTSAQKPQESKGE